MPTIARNDEFRFAIYPRDHNPPHTHVILSDGTEYRINLLSGDFLDHPLPSRSVRRRIMDIYNENLERLWEEWEKYHNPTQA